MVSLRDKILKAKSDKEIDSLVDEFGSYENASTNTKTKVNRAVKQRRFELSDKGSKKSKKKDRKNENSSTRRK
tara:strand:+ start:2839 stop:3057 length:219 start_codon:yes stop_codon:yes gene_type:complete